MCAAAAANTEKLNSKFIKAKMPHALLITTHGYAGPTFPASAPDSGGQITYVNNLARELARKGYKVTIATRAFEYSTEKSADGFSEQERYEPKFGKRRGAAFMADEPLVRYVYVPGLVSCFIPKEQIYADIPAVAKNLAQLIGDEAKSVSLKPWEYVEFINSHYVDGGMVGQMLVHYWQDDIVVAHIKDRFAKLLPKEFDALDVSIIDNLPFHLGELVVQAWREDQNVTGGGWNFETLLRWVGERVSWRPERLDGALSHLPEQGQAGADVVGEYQDLYTLGDVLLKEVGHGVTLKGKMASVNKHAWTPHSLGALKLQNSLRIGLHQTKPSEFLSLHFPERMEFERGIIGSGTYGDERLFAFFSGPPPARVLVPTSPEILDYLFAEGASAKSRQVYFPPGTHPDLYSPRPSIKDAEVRSLIDYFGASGVPPTMVERMRTNPQSFNLIIEASRMDKTKRKELLVQAMKHLPENTLLFITGGRDEKGVYDSISKLIGELNLKERAFMLGRVPDELMAPLMSLPQGEGRDQFHMVIGASASRMEGWGMSVQDMTAGGYPLVSSEFVPYAVHLRQRDDAAQIVWMAEENKKGPVAYAELIRSLIDDPAAARQMADRGRAVASEFGWSKLVERFVEGVAGFLPAPYKEDGSIHSVILAGGVGKRLVPLSSKEKPKQFLPITHKSMSMLQQTWERLSVDPQHVYVATNADYVRLVTSQLPSVPAQNIVGEPVMRNTAPAIATLMYQIAMRDPDGVAVVLPADHWIENSKAFRKRVEEAARVARETDALVTFGIEPTWPSPEYGYIQRREEKVVGFTDSYAVSRFVEKPDESVAKRYLAEGNYYWNSGMFVWRAAVFLDLLERYQPVMIAALESIYGPTLARGSISQASLLKFFKGLHGISIDYALMEPAAADGRVVVLSLDTPWSDVGTWEGLDRLVQDGKVKPPDEVRRILDEKFPRK